MKKLFILAATAAAVLIPLTTLASTPASAEAISNPLTSFNFQGVTRVLPLPPTAPTATLLGPASQGPRTAPLVVCAPVSQLPSSFNCGPQGR